MKKAIFLFVMILLPLIANADAVEIDGIYYNLISKVNVAEVACGPFTYKKDDHGNSTPAKGYYKGSIVIPESVTYEGVNYSVASINGGKDFYYSSPGGSFSYHGGAFYMCDELTSIVIPSSVTLIGSDTFYGCSSLTSITIPEGVTSIESGVFCECI